MKGEGFAEDYKVNRDCSGEDINYQKENMFIFLLKSLPPRDTENLGSESGVAVQSPYFTLEMVVC